MAATDFVTEAQVDALTTNVATAVKANTTAINNHLADATDAHDASAISIVDAGSKYTATDVEAALQEVKTVADAAAGGGVAINDAATNTTQTWSSQKSTDYVAAQIATVIASAPAALDTLDELAAALGDDANFASTVTTALSNRLRFDAAQTLTAPQKAQGQANLGVVSSTVDFAANFNTLIA